MSSQASFAQLGLPHELVESLANRRITEPFEIQTKAVPDAVVGRDILGRAPTGSGKTLAFGLPLLARLEQGGKKKPRGLILSPTRELAEQICRELEPLAQAMDRSVLAVYGGTGLDRQIKALRRGVDLLVACPGRLLDLIEQKACRLDQVDIVVVDEADRMADMGFLPDVKRILDQTSEDRQTVLFSATLDNDVQVLIDNYQNDPVVHEVGDVEPDLSLVDHRFIKVKKTDRVWLAADVIADAGPTVIFVRTRHGVDRLARQLKQEGIKAGYIHGGRTQSQRDRALQVFTDGKVDALVATDVAARGIHVDGVACVIHYDPPADRKDYVHRSGRTARAGADGVVVSFLDPPQVKESQKMQRKLGIEAEIEPLPARQPRSSRPDPIVEGKEGTSSGAKSGGKSKSGKGGTKSRKPEAKSDRTKDRARDRDREKGNDRTGKPARSRKPAERDSSRRTRSNRTDSTDRSGNEETRPETNGRGTGRSRNTQSRNGESRNTQSRNGQSRNGQSGSGQAGRNGQASAPRNGAVSGPDAKPTGEERPETGRTRKPAPTRGPGKAKAKTGGKGAVKAKSKRSGKPRPKNRKNKPKTGRVRNS